MVGASLMLITVRLKPPNEFDALLVSVTVITMPVVVVPTSTFVGEPVNAPVVVLKLAQVGLLTILKVNASFSSSKAAGIKLYTTSCTILVAGVPLIVGAALQADVVKELPSPVVSRVEVAS